MPTLKEPPHRTQRTRMHTHQNTVFLLINLRHSLPRRRSPSQEHHPLIPLLRHEINNLLREFLPAFPGMRVGFVGAHRETCVEEEYSAVGPRCEETCPVGRGSEVRIVDF